jgi:hypothetical protein
LTVSIVDGSGNYYVWFVDTVVGELPREWIVESPATGFLWGSASTMLTIRVPAGTPGGTYAGHVFSEAMSSHGYADAGDGLYLEVLVPSGCGGAPEVRIDSVDPPYLWPPNGRMEQIAISGTIVLPEGCTLYEAGYGVDDEYGVYNEVSTFTPGADGTFTALVTLEASRQGGDIDGRRYTITVYAEDEAGIGSSQGIDVIVHDQRSK